MRTDGIAVTASALDNHLGLAQRIEDLAVEQFVAQECNFRVAPMFETGAERYAWLNNILIVGVGERLPAKYGFGTRSSRYFNQMPAGSSLITSGCRFPAPSQLREILFPEFHRAADIVAAPHGFPLAQFGPPDLARDCLRQFTKSLPFSNFARVPRIPGGCGARITPPAALGNGKSPQHGWGRSKLQ
jgi:hypothetical protein